jgi:hypothetical protein
MECKNCGHEAGNKEMGKHYRENPSHRPKYQPVQHASSNGTGPTTIIDKVKLLHEEILSTLFTNRQKIEELKMSIQSLESQNATLETISHQIDPDSDRIGNQERRAA